METPSFILRVVGGDDDGAQLVVGGELRTIGRARDADLVLQDLAVSRHHVQVVATTEGVRLQASANSTPFVVDGKSHRSFQAKLGDRVLVGNSVLLVGAVEADVIPAPTPSQAVSHTDVGTLMTGPGADALAMAAVHSLIAVLDSASDRHTLVAALVAWSAEQSSTCTVEMRSTSGGNNQVVERDEGGATTIIVPAPGDEPVALEFRCAAPAERVSDSFRRMLVVAGRLFGSSLVRLHHSEVAAHEVASLRALSFGTARNFMGSSLGAQQLAVRIPRLALSDVSVLIEGETGVGKTFVARLIHEAGPRAREPLRVINCAAIPEALLESELFGHERGAFSGAVGQRIGALEAVGRGTLFLDEIGELTPASQAKLLHVLEERKFERVGSNHTIELRARVLCATNRDLDQMVSAEKFRHDLLYRLAVVRLAVPPLRERGDDLLDLARQLLADAAQSAGRRIVGISPDAIALIRGYSWPGNVRELRNAVHHAVALGEGSLVTPADLPPGLGVAHVQPKDADLVRLPLALSELERRGIDAALRHTGGNKTRAAALLGISRPTLNSRLGEKPASEPEE